MFNSIILILVIGVLNFNFSIIKKDPEYFKQILIHLFISLLILLSAQFIKTEFSELSLNKIKEKDPIRFSQMYQSTTNPAFTLVHYYKSSNQNQPLVDRLEMWYIILSFALMSSLGFYLLTAWKIALNDKVTKMPLNLRFLYLAISTTFLTMIYFPMVYSIITFTKFN